MALVLQIHVTSGVDSPANALVGEVSQGGFRHSLHCVPPGWSLAVALLCGS